jgi:predicted MFS family arabinose efflux permease
MGCRTLHHKTVHDAGVVATVTVFGFSFMTLLPAWAVEVLGGNATTNGLLRSAQGVGALAGALTLASLGRFKFRGRLVTLGSLLFPVTLMVLSRITYLPLSLLTVAVAGGMVILVNNVSNSLIQDNVSDELRGRVSSIFSLTFFGAMPVGAVLIGQLAEYAGPQTAVLAGGAVLLVCSLLVWLLAPDVRKLE